MIRDGKVVLGNLWVVWSMIRKNGMFVMCLILCDFLMKWNVLVLSVLRFFNCKNV